MSFYFSGGTLSLNNQRLISLTLWPAELWMTATVPLRPTIKSYWKDFINIHKILKSAWYGSEWDSSFFRHVCNYYLLSCLCVSLSICLHGATRLSLDRFSWNFTFEYFLKICWKIQVDSNLPRVMGTLHEDVCVFMIISCLIFLRMRYVSD